MDDDVERSHGWRRFDETGQPHPAARVTGIDHCLQLASGELAVGSVVNRSTDDVAANRAPYCELLHRVEKHLMALPPRVGRDESDASHSGWCGRQSGQSIQIEARSRWSEDIQIN